MESAASSACARIRWLPHALQRRGLAAASARQSRQTPDMGNRIRAVQLYPLPPMPWIPVSVKAGKDIDGIAGGAIDDAIWKFRDESAAPMAQQLCVGEGTLRYPIESSFGCSAEFAPEAAALLFVPDDGVLKLARRLRVKDEAAQSNLSR